ncbi:DUF4291 domain-containing protein [Micromonospora sp. NBC_01813]|uniref:DUF4291 domain-containing protein n=1 Tax=Micromonospora sp. NBC_01813 TaxID=2975988 RepID=UPI002DDA4AA1|nr:DUF4291 domain-containing protein [Micromonospora sp. NBC_01813]WSA08287.1 DUF4291 domain-containing protein [Micromonospora sp. NBC_01813]
MSVPYRQIRARFDEQTITVYQAYSPEIAAPAVAAGRFVAPFKRGRMTWIKPSFLWMMYRSGWASKPGQERVLAVEILRSGFEAALAQACLSHYDRDLYPDRAAWSRLVKTSQVRVQWDPERSPHLGPLPYRSLQVGLSGQVVDRYVDDWTVAVSDVTARARAIRDRLAAGGGALPPDLLPVERPYPLPAPIGATIGITDQALMSGGDESR